jgi:hypothetical protein
MLLNDQVDCIGDLFGSGDRPARPIPEICLKGDYEADS